MNALGNCHECGERKPCACVPATPVPDMVEAVDREAALKFFPADLWRQEARDGIALAFASHRIAALTACRAQVEQQERDRIVAWLRGAFQQHRKHPEDQAFARHIADAITRNEHRSADNG